MKAFLTLLWSVFTGVNDWLVSFFSQASGLNEFDLFMLHAANERRRQLQEESSWAQDDHEYNDWQYYEGDYGDDGDYGQHI